MRTEGNTEIKEIEMVEIVIIQRDYGLLSSLSRERYVRFCHRESVARRREEKEIREPMLCHLCFTKPLQA